jgi:hypothetical protein
LVSIFNLNFNVVVGGLTIISKSVTLKILLAFFEIVIPDPWSSFSVASYNQLTGNFNNYHLKTPRGFGGLETAPGEKGTQSPFRALSGVL